MGEAMGEAKKKGATRKDLVKGKKFQRDIRRAVAAVECNPYRPHHGSFDESCNEEHESIMTRHR